MPKRLYSPKTGSISVAGAQVHLRYDFSLWTSTSTIKSNLQAPIQHGISAVNFLHDQIQSASTSGIKNDYEFRELLHKYFFVDRNSHIDEITWLTLRAVLHCMKVGFQGSNTIKIYSENANSLVGGYVKTYRGADAKQKHRTLGFRTYEEGNTIKVSKGFRGDIHINSGVLAGRSNLTNAVTFVHESSHKFADTADFGFKGYVCNKTGNYYEDGLTHDQALMNADSFANLIVQYYFMANGISSR